MHLMGLLLIKVNLICRRFDIFTDDIRKLIFSKIKIEISVFQSKLNLLTSKISLFLKLNLHTSDLQFLIIGKRRNSIILTTSLF